MIDIQIAKFNSDLHIKSIDLRTRVLRKPLGLTFSTQELQAEHNHIHIVAIQNERVIGVLLLKIINKQILKMRQVAIDFDFQQKGYGKLLVEYAELYAKQNQYKIIELHARKTAVPFYSKLNYTIQGNEFLEIQIPHYKMSKKLL